jgi:hypothetical protein
MHNIFKVSYIVLLCSAVTAEIYGGELYCDKENMPPNIRLKKSPPKKRKADSLPPNLPLNSPTKRKKLEDHLYLSSDTIADCRDVGMSHEKIGEAALYTRMMQKKDISPEQLEASQQIGADYNEVCSWRKRKGKNFQTIHNPNLLGDDILFSDATLEAGNSRYQQKTLKDRKVIVDTCPQDFVPEEPVETPEERRQRRAEHDRLFQEEELKRGVSPEDIADTAEKFNKIMEPYFNIIKKLKKSVSNGERGKIRPGEVEEIFDKCVAPHLESIEVEGYIVYFLPGMVDLKRKNLAGQTNRQLMGRGFCPIGWDGKPMNYHHLTQFDYGTHGNKPGNKCRIILMHQTFHQETSGDLHYCKANYYLPTTEIDRGVFDGYRESFNKEIVKRLRSK